MHEYSIVQALYDGVMVHARTRPAAQVHEVHVCIGELSGVDVGLLQTAWRTFRVHTPCEAAELSVDVVAARWECPACPLASPPPRSVLRCLTCGGPLRLAQGDEILLNQIVLEVSDV
jgi:hydrogenase nickel incorporation protein HypA/HybF